MPPTSHNKTKQPRSSTGKIIIIVIVFAVIGLVWAGQRAVANKISQQNYNDAKKLLINKKPKEAYAKLLHAKSYALKKEGPEYYVRMAGIALTNNDKKAAKQQVSDGFKALKNYKKKDKAKINKQLEQMQKSIDDYQPPSDKKPPTLDFKNLKKHSDT